MNIQRKLNIAAALLSIVASMFYLNNAAIARSRVEIDEGVKEALTRFEKDIKGGPEYLKAAKGVLIMPHLHKAGFIVAGEYGQGALQIDGKTIQYYKLVSGSLGYQAGAERYDMVIVFMTDDSLNKFRESKGWEAGVDAEVTLVKVGAEASVETLRSQSPIVGFVFDQKGIMAGVSAKGAKFSPIHPK